MTMRADLQGAEKAVMEVLDEVLVRHHGILPGSHHEDDFLAWLAERGYRVVPVDADSGWRPE